MALQIVLPLIGLPKTQKIPKMPKIGKSGYFEGLFSVSWSSILKNFVFGYHRTDIEVHFTMLIFLSFNVLGVEGAQNGPP